MMEIGTTVLSYTQAVASTVPKVKIPPIPSYFDLLIDTLSLRH
jgi:hypothetical protein